MSNSLDQDLRTRIQAFVDELSVLVKQAALEAVRAALGGRAAGQSKVGRRGRAAASAPAGRRRRGGKRNSAELGAMAAKVLAHVKSHAGQGVEHISKALGIPSKDLKLPITKLLSDRKLKTSGRRRGTKYFAR